MAKRYSAVCGQTIYVKITQGKKGIPGQKRQTKHQVTKLSVREYNRRMAERNLSMLLNHNFKPGDMHIVLTYREAPNAETAKKDLKNFLDRLRRAYRKVGMTLKWIGVTEYENKRPHHHLIVNQGKSLADIIRIWGKGISRCSVLDESGDYRKLASYLIKETEKTFRNPDAVQRQRFAHSKSVVYPQIREEEVSAAALLKDPKPIKGYYIDPESIVWGRNPETECAYMEYVMVSMDANPRLSAWPRGKKVPWFAGEKWLREKEAQMTMFEQREPAEDLRAFCDAEKGVKR